MRGTIITSGLLNGMKKLRVTAAFFLIALLVHVFSQEINVGWAAEGRSWRYVSELSQEELQKLDLRSETPRDATFPYLPAEPYPYATPYTAEEMGLISTEFAHMPRRNCALIEDYGTISANGYLTTAQAIGLVSYRSAGAIVWNNHWVYHTPGLVCNCPSKPAGSR